MNRTRKHRPLWAEEADLELRRRGITQTAFAKQIGLSRQAVSTAINTGECGIGAKERICTPLGIPMD